MSAAGYTPESTHFRRVLGTQKFKGSVFIQLDSVENAEKFVKDAPKVRAAHQWLSRSTAEG